MCKRYQLFAVLSYIHIINAANIPFTSSTSTSVKPSTLLLPSGFDSQQPPRQPMLYPFVVPSSLSPTTPTTRIPSRSFITAGWIPISSSKVNVKVNHIETSTVSTSKPSPVPILEDRISKYVLSSNDNGPVFESIIYGTWKPDPPLQPVNILNNTTPKYINGNNDISNNNTSSNSGRLDEGKVSNKTINRQHGGFIDNKQQKPIKIEKQQQFYKDSYEKFAFEQKINESVDSGEQKPLSKFLKKQGRQKIRPNSTTTNTTAMTTTSTAATQQQFPIDSTEQIATTLQIATSSQDANNKVSLSVPAEVVRQINDSIEIKYNHKQTSRHSIEMTAHERYDQHHHNHHSHYRSDIDDYDYDTEEQTQKTLTTTTELQLQQQEKDEDDDDDEEEKDESGNSSVIRMNWPTDFMDVPQSSSSTSTENVSDAMDSSSSTTHQNIKSDSSELPLALNALNIPPSLWPKLPGNITKLGSPYAAENSLEEPAICVPITVREFNMMNSNEVVSIERVFCFPMPTSTTKVRETVMRTSTTRSSSSRIRGRSTISPVVKANIQSYEDIFESQSHNSSNSLASPLYVVCCVLAVYHKFIY